MKKAILFDLDGTLLPMDLNIFLKEYLKSVTGVTSHLVAPQKMAQYIMESTQKVIENIDPERTNEEVFIEDFVKRVGHDRELIMPLFDRYYEEQFDALYYTAQPHPLVPEIIELAERKGYRRILATSPIFPRRAILSRIRWAGLDPDAFEFITSYEDMHATKPNLEYYQEILDRLGLKGEECFMVGNDAEEDLVASKLGMKVFWLKDFAISRGQEQPQFDGSGSYTDLLEWIAALPDVGGKSRTVSACAKG